MSIWIFDRAPIKPIIVLLLAASLTACGSSRLGTASPKSTTGNTPKDTVRVSGRDVIVKGPQGFCIDRESSQLGGDLVFVLLGSCRVVAPSAFAASPNVKALLTASLSGTASDGTIAGSMNSMDQFFRSDDGRTALSRASDPGTVQVLETFQQDDTFFIRAIDNSEGIVPGAADDYWRAYFDLNEQIVSVSVIGFEDDPISPDTGLSTLRQFSHSLKTQNGIDATPPPVVEETPAEPTTKPKPSKKKTVRDARNVFWSIGLLRKLIK